MLGIDVSHWDGIVDWQIAKPLITFAFIKATDGDSFIDPQFERNWTETQRLAIPHGAYHYYRPSKDPIQQANHFCKIAPLGTLPHVLDLEEKNGAWSRLPEKVFTFLNVVEDLTGIIPIIYTSPGYWNSYMSTATWADRYPLWIAHYNFQSPAIPLPWHPYGWRYWQFTDRGNGPKYGCQSRSADLNIYNPWSSHV